MELVDDENWQYLLQLVRLPDQWAVATAVVPAECSVVTAAFTQFMQARCYDFIANEVSFFATGFLVLRQ